MNAFVGERPVLGEAAPGQGGKRKGAANRADIVTLKMSDEALVQAARKGDRIAFDTLVDRYARAVLSRLLAWTRDASAAEDLAQETFLRAWQGLGRLREPQAFGSWLLSIGGFVGQEWLRRKKTDQRVRAALGPPPVRTRREDGPDLPLAEAVAGLAPEIQHLLALRHDRGLSCLEISRELGRPLGTVTKSLSRAYEQLRERLDRT